tara:strand:- start:457 stop:690 length:234 start_codon:yes stop_codon:yes gene_type:complete
MKKNLEILRTDDLYPDGVKITVDWADMIVGSSIFIPCVDTTTAKNQVKAVFKGKKWDYIMDIRAESGILGVRVWRTL